jgi:polyhydroxyalkanoate synthase
VLWLGERSSDPIVPPPLGRPGGTFVALEDAPGRYVFMK